MSIRRRLILLIIFLVVFPMLSLMAISKIMLERQIENSARNYLINASKVAQSIMFSRIDKMEKTASLLVVTDDFLTAVENNDGADIYQKLLQMQRINECADYVFFLDADNNVVCSLPASLSPVFYDFKVLIDKARHEKRPVIANQALVLDNLLLPESVEYKKFQVKLQDGNEIFGYLHSLTTVIPVFSRDGNYLGTMVMGDITNNDSFLPERYSWYVKDSYLSLSLYDVRVTSNIKSGQKTNFIGSLTPVKVDTLEGEKDYYFGQARIDDEIHFFLDCPLYDEKDKIIGALGVGIPQQKFNILQKVNSNIILGQTFILLVIMLIIGKFTADEISQPILEAARCAEEISKGEREPVIKSKFLRNSYTETMLLLDNLQKMARELRMREEEIESFIEQLSEEHRKQKEMSRQLQELNDELEKKVQIRTRELEETVKILQKSDQVKTRFLANMSHELRTPLNVIITSTQALSSEVFGPLNEKQHKYISNIEASARNLLHLLNDILDIAKIQAGKMTLCLGVFSVFDLLLNSIDEIRGWAENKQLEVECRWFTDDFLVMVDRQKFRQIMYNILSNAIKFTPQGGRIEIKLWRDGTFYWIAVKDNGIGIPEEYQDIVFEEFEQLDNSYAREYEGTGLGLPLAKKMVELHGGEIFLFSKPGEGTEVVIKMPVAMTEGLLPDRGDDVNDQDSVGG